MNTMTDNRTAEEVLRGYFAELVTEPVKKTWTPDEYAIKHYSTPKRMEREAAKREAENLRQFNREMSEYTRLRNALEKVCSVQLGLMDFFAHTLASWIESARAHRDALTKKLADFRDVWDREFPYTYDSAYAGSGHHQSKVNAFYSRHDILRRCWKCELRNGYIYTAKSLEGELNAQERDARGLYYQQFDGFAKTDEEKIAFAKAAIQYELDEHELHAAVTPQEIFARTIVRLAEIVDAMVKTLGGMPDGFERDHKWGIGGMYNGIVSRQGKRAKFTSFYAGGWNIQCLHIRYRVTALKD